MTPPQGKPGAYSLEAALACLLCGLVMWLGMHAQLSYLWWRWTSSGLRSLGMLLPLASLILARRAWRGEDSSGQGSGWGAIMMAAALAAARWLQLPAGLLAWSFIGGAVIWFRGWRDWRRAWFGLGLLLLLNPVPMFITATFDTRLQSLAVTLAQSVAAGLGMQPVRHGYSLDFANGESMYLAASCNGLRSVVALSYIAMIAAYWHSLAWLRLAASVLGAMVLAYALNGLRLSGLVVFHLLAGQWPGLNGGEPMVDHLLGGLLFLGGAAGVLTWIGRQPRRTAAAAMAAPLAVQL